ncbi:hypothetical protein JJQ50_00125 [Enterobacter cloacae]|uniref:hypothetical protein n=1 Tax=Enterobacter TaxID=547 RepID=UPI0018ED8FAA|nr:hypothetical protein [Enterobacter quasihormaechei]MBJ6386385.1 hypothetical protein [Enterobacter cloacae]MBJ6434799.1 hypothetical protein [Enterobacter cloacae]MBJ6521204.1 hypothetical protein [Enterobacter cloacae]MBJ6576376.1 hypothetical protein [Enterobacter cloacae]MBK4220636.1 hypothetical protein [Enterobacter cloacae]
MPLNIMRNVVRHSRIGISVPETMNGNVTDNAVENADLGLEVRSSQQEILQLLKEGFPGEKLTELLLHISTNPQESFDERVDYAKKSGLVEWLQPGTTVVEFVTALISLASSFGGS